MFKKIIIGFDSRGEKIVDFVKEKLQELKIETVVADCKNLDYVDATKLCCGLFEKDFTIDGLILICGTGVGVCMASNRFSFIRSCLASNKNIVYYSRRHEDSNCLCLSAGYSDNKVEVLLDKENIDNCIEAFVNTKFEGGRHKERVNKLKTIGE